MARIGWSVLGMSQDETVIVEALAVVLGGWRARLEYVLDRDFASQYDKTETWTGEVVVDDDGALVAAEWRDERAR